VLRDINSVFATVDDGEQLEWVLGIPSMCPSMNWNVIIDAKALCDFQDTEWVSLAKLIGDGARQSDWNPVIASVARDHMETFLVPRTGNCHQSSHGEIMPQIEAAGATPGVRPRGRTAPGNGDVDSNETRVRTLLATGTSDR
jgi:hypothetical protein